MKGRRRFGFFAAPDRETAHALLRAAGLDAESHALQIRTSGGDWSIEGTILPAVAASLTLLGFLLWSTSAGVCLLIAAIGTMFAAGVQRPMLSRIDLRIGTDGVLHTRLWQSHFSPFTQIRRVWPIGSRVAMQLVDESIVVLKYDGPSTSDKATRMSRDRAMVELIRMRVLEGHRAGHRSDRDLATGFRGCARCSPGACVARRAAEAQSGNRRLSNRAANRNRSRRPVRRRIARHANAHWCRHRIARATWRRSCAALANRRERDGVSGAPSRIRANCRGVVRRGHRRTDRENKVDPRSVTLSVWSRRQMVSRAI